MSGRGVIVAVLLQGLLFAQDLSRPFAPGDSFSISHTPMTAKLVPIDCDAKRVPIRSYKHAGNEATFLIPEDSPTCTYELMGIRIKVVRPADYKSAAEVKPGKPAPSTPK